MSNEPGIVKAMTSQFENKNVQPDSKDGGNNMNPSTIVPDTKQSLQSNMDEAHITKKVESDASATREEEEFQLAAEVLPNESQTNVEDGANTKKIEFEENNGAIVLTWSTVENAENYKIHVSRKRNEILNRNSKLPRCELKSTRYQWDIGEIIIVDVTGVDKEHREVPICKDYKYIVGGDFVPGEFTLTHGKSNPSEEIALQWHPAMTKPMHYEVTVYEQQGKRSDVIKTFRTSDIEDSLKNLKPSTEYYCMVIAKYQQMPTEKPVLSNTIKTAAEINTKLKRPQQVQAYVDPKNSARNIIVTWEKPKKAKISHYEVYLMYDKDKKTDPKNVGLANKASFQWLRSNTIYHACVETHVENQKDVFRGYSDNVKTDEAQRNEDFDIQASGKPTIITCQTVEKGNVLASKFEWELSDLKDVKDNYRLLQTRASMQEGEETIPLAIDGDQPKTKPHALEWDKQYTFNVSCTFEDLDSGKTSHVASTRILTTGFGMPRLLSIDSQEDHVNISWSPACGASKHVLTVLSDNGTIAATSTPLQHHAIQVEMNSLCTYGKTCKFILEASGATGKTKDEKTVLIGGKKAVTEVDAKNDKRKLMVTWKAPQNPPNGYKLVIREIGEKSATKEEVNALEPTQTSYCFDELKSSTKYQCTVHPIYYNGPVDGTSSQIIQTQPREASFQERINNFGKPENITHNTKPDSSIAEISWRTVHLGHNYKLTGYAVVVQQVNRLFRNTTMLSTNVKPNDTKVEVKDLKSGYEYKVEVTTLYNDLDTGKKIKKSDQYSFSTKPSEIEIYECTWQDRIVTFTWQPATGAKKYVLLIMDDLGKEELAPKIEIEASEEGKGCKAEVPMSEIFGIGTTCLTKVIVHGQNNLTSKSDWKAHLIGGNEVPRNVKTTTNEDGPQSKRSLKIAFDHPRQGHAVEYNITAIPKDGGRRKTQQAKESPVVVKYLRKGVSYTFEVSAKWNGQWSTPSVSNPMFTDGDANENPLFGLQNVKGSTVDLSNASLRGSNTTLNVMGGDFGKARDIRKTITSRGEKDITTIHWKIPSFDNYLDDYKVERYKIEIRKRNDTENGGRNHFVKFVEGKLEYSSGEYELELGEIYVVSVSTIYDDIDQDMIQISSAVNLEVITRPCKPSVSCNECKSNKLRIEWNATKGAHHYEVEIHTENSSTITKDMQKSTELTMEFHEKFGYGTTYYAVIKAFGIDNKTNSCLTQKETIGGKYVPTNVVATIDNFNVNDRNTQAFLSWNAPTLPPKSYLISATPEVDNLNTDLKGLSCLVSGLKAGSFYYFKVEAVHVKEEDGKEIRSGGCASNKIQTNPTPTQVKNVRSPPDKNCSSCIHVYWNQVDAEKANENAKYRVCLKKRDGTDERQIYVETENAIFGALQPGASYDITVSGGNSIGYGQDSDKLTVTTDLGLPSNVCLVNNSSDPSNSVILKFSDAEGEPTCYTATLCMYQNQIENHVRGPENVKSGHKYLDLESNTEYVVKVHAVFAAGQGEPVPSKKLLTAPPKPAIADSGCTSGEDEQKSSRNIFAKWNSESGCDSHEVRITRGSKGTVECVVSIASKNNIIYSCLNEAAQYTLQVRSKNASGYFGDWSDPAVVQLAPTKLEGVTAKLEEKGDKITVQCQTAQGQSLRYFMANVSRSPNEEKETVCDDQPIAEPEQGEENVERKTVEWIFNPPEQAKEYTFELWAERSHEIKGKPTISKPVISRPSKGEIKTLRVCAESSSTDIEIYWEPMERCNSYEVKFLILNQEEAEHVAKTKKTSLLYRCLSPGNTYLVSLRAICDSVKGSWSAYKEIKLAPAEVQLKEVKESRSHPVKRIVIEWQNMKICPEGYLVKLYCDDKEIAEDKTPDTKHKFDGEILKPGSLCHCTVAAYNGKLIGQTTKSKDYRIVWTKPSAFSITPDDNEPSRKAKMKWDRPTGVDCFKLEIENNQTGVVTTIIITDKRYVFESGIPGNTYSVRLYCGCDNRYDIHHIQQTMTMKPEPPTDVRVSANEQVKGLTIEFKDTPSIRKKYEITVEGLIDPMVKIKKNTSLRSLTLRGLVPGESYKVCVSAIIGESRSNAATSEGYISTLPDEVKSLRSVMERGSVLFEWDKLEIKPSKYIVQWRVDNEPITEEHTQATSFMIFFLKPAHCYSARVMAANSSGVGPMSDWENFITDPSPPYDVRVYPDTESPKTSLIVKYQDEKDTLKRYRITAEGPGEEPKSVVTHEHFAILSGLKPGTAYMVKVQTLFCGKESVGAPFSRI